MKISCVHQHCFHSDLPCYPFHLLFRVKVTPHPLRNIYYTYRYLISSKIDWLLHLFRVMPNSSLVRWKKWKRFWGLLLQQGNNMKKYLVCPSLNFFADCQMVGVYHTWYKKSVPSSLTRVSGFTYRISLQSVVVLSKCGQVIMHLHVNWSWKMWPDATKWVALRIWEKWEKGKSKKKKKKKKKKNYFFIF
jgi:hypothetical protein